jgi:hypothetical protein
MAGYYNGLLQAVEECTSKQRAFMVIDCPSGRGKSLSGIALRLLDRSCECEPVARKFGNNTRVAHIVWDKALDSQKIYQPLHQQQESDGVHVNSFYPRARQLYREETATGIPIDRISGDREAYVWEKLLQFLFVKNAQDPFDLNLFKVVHGLDQGRLLILFLDEIPTDPIDVHFIGWVRDLVRFVPKILVILAGTNSKAANMLGLMSGEASANDYNAQYQHWSFLVTRLPAYNVVLSSFSARWDLCQSAAQDNENIADVVKVIKNSIKNDGNPRLINLAIDVLAEMLPLESISFLEWQTKFASRVSENKFYVARWSEFHYTLIGQANLLLTASMFQATSDILVNKHFAHRAVPDGNVLATRLGCSVEDCGGWLRVSADDARAAGMPLFFQAGAADSSTLRYYGWQITVFASVASDPLLYLGCCFPRGYFATPRSLTRSTFSAYRVAQVLWSENAIGKLNFQNIQAPANSGALLEVATSLAIINAAAVSTELVMTLSQYLLNFLQQMCVKIDTLAVHLHSELAFRGCSVPKFIFPSVERNVPEMSQKLFGMLYRTANAEQMDACLEYPFGCNELGVQVQRIHFECKYWEEPGALKEMFKIARKLIRKRGDIAVSVHCKCHDFWGSFKASNFEKLAKNLTNSEVGEILCVNQEGAVSSRVISDKPGILIVVEVGAGWKPQDVVTEKFKFDMEN